MANEVVVNIKADATKAKAAIGSFQDRVKKAADSVRRMGFAIGAVGTAVTFGFLKAANTTSIFQDRIGKLNKATGMSTDVLQGLAHAAELGGVNLAAVETSTRKMAVAISEAKGGTATYKDLFDQLGVSMADLEGLSMDKAFAKLGDAIAKLPEDMDKSSVATQLFGKSGQALIPLFEEGVSGAVADSIEMLKRFGSFTEQEGIRASEEYRDALANLAKVQTGLTTTIGNVLIPELTRLADSFREATEPLFVWIKANPDLTRGILKLTAIIAAVMIPIGALMVGLPLLILLIKGLVVVVAGVGLPFLAVAGAVALAVVAFRRFEIVRDIVSFVFNEIIGFIEAGVNSFVTLVNAISSGVNWLVGKIPKLGEVLGVDFIEPMEKVEFTADGMVTAVKDKFSDLGNAFKNFGSVSKEHFEGVAMSFEEMADVLQGEALEVEKSINNVAGAFEEMLDVLGGEAHHKGQGVKGIPLSREAKAAMLEESGLGIVMKDMERALGISKRRIGSASSTGDADFSSGTATMEWLARNNVTLINYGTVQQVVKQEDLDGAVDKKMREGING